MHWCWYCLEKKAQLHANYQKSWKIPRTSSLNGRKTMLCYALIFTSTLLWFSLAPWNFWGWDMDGWMLSDDSYTHNIGHSCPDPLFFLTANANHWANKKEKGVVLISSCEISVCHQFPIGCATWIACSSWKIHRHHSEQNGNLLSFASLLAQLGESTTKAARNSTQLISAS